MQTRGEETSLELLQVDSRSPIEAGMGSVSGANQADPATSFPVGAKIRPIIRSPSKEGPSTQTPTSTKRPTKTPSKGSSSKRPKR